MNGGTQLSLSSTLDHRGKRLKTTYICYFGDNEKCIFLGLNKTAAEVQISTFFHTLARYFV